MKGNSFNFSNLPKNKIEFLDKNGVLEQCDMSNRLIIGEEIFFRGD